MFWYRIQRLSTKDDVAFRVTLYRPLTPRRWRTIGILESAPREIDVIALLLVTIGASSSSGARACGARSGRLRRWRLGVDRRDWRVLVRHRLDLLERCVVNSVDCFAEVCSTPCGDRRTTTCTDDYKAYTACMSNRVPYLLEETFKSAYTCADAASSSSSATPATGECVGRPSNYAYRFVRVVVEVNGSVTMNSCNDSTCGDKSGTLGMCLVGLLKQQEGRPSTCPDTTTTPSRQTTGRSSNKGNGRHRSRSGVERASTLVLPSCWA